MSTPRLIGVALCPYVQRVAIVLREKRLAFCYEEIDLRWPPAWPLARAPQVQVPLLLEGERVPESG